MSRIKACFEVLAKTGKKALVPYIVAGDPEPSVTVALMHRLVDAGADIIELGVPFSDPMAEGVVIQKAHERALAHHVSLDQILTMVAEFRRGNSETPVVLMGYANPIEIMGYKVFAEKANKAGVDGLLTVDMPPEEAAELNTELVANGIDIICLIAPTTTDKRAATICANATGYIYYVSLKGVTGAGNLDVDSVATRIQQLREYAQIPLCVGFGINSPEAAQRIAAVADGVVVGSALVNKFGGQNSFQQASDEAISLLQAMRVKMDA